MHISSILTFSSHAYASQEEQNQKRLFQFAQALHTAPCYQLATDFPLLDTSKSDSLRKFKKKKGLIV